MIHRFGDYVMDDDPERVQRDALWGFLSHDAYWGRWRTRQDIEAQLGSAWRVVGCYSGGTGEMVGFARAVSDGVALAYLADVYVLPGHRGHGLGVELVRVMIEEGPGARFRWTLHTDDAHDMYRRFGFREPDRTYLERRASRGGTASTDRADSSDQQQTFVAVLLFESTSPSPGYRPLYREDMALLRASSVADAETVAERHGRDRETSYRNDRGETITDRLLHVVDVAPALDDDLTTSADLYSRVFRDVTAYRRFEPKLDGEPL